MKKYYIESRNIYKIRCKGVLFNYEIWIIITIMTTIFMGGYDQIKKKIVFKLKKVRKKHTSSTFWEYFFKKSNMYMYTLTHIYAHVCICMHT